MRAARVLSFGSVPPEWGGLLRGGVATFQAALVAELAAGPVRGAEVVGIVTKASTELGSAPVPCHTPRHGQPLDEFLGFLLTEVRPDVALLNHFATAWGRLLPKLAPDLPLVGVAHSWHRITQLSDPVARSEATGQVQLAMDGLRALVTVSEHARREGLALGLRYPQDTVVIPYPLAQAFTEPLEVDLPRSGVLFVGSLIERKNPGTLLDAVSLLPEVTVTLAGEGPEEGELRSRASALGIAERVRIEQHPVNGHVAWLRTLMARSELLCVPSASESFGLVYIEALACGTPVAGFGPTLREISSAVGLDIGIPLQRVTMESVAAAIEQVRAGTWHHRLLQNATRRSFAAAGTANRYAEVLSRAAGPLTISRQELEERVSSLGTWHYEIDLGGLTTPIRAPDHVNRHSQRRRYLFDPLLRACGGSLEGKRVLDLGCNAGFWSLCAVEAGCDHVLGIDGRMNHVNQAMLVFEARRIEPERYSFRRADVFELDLEEMRFDLVLCLGLLYHVNQPVALFERLGRWAEDLLVIDTSLSELPGSAFELRRESLDDPRNATESPYVLRPTREAVIELATGFGFDVLPLVPQFSDYAGAEDFQDGRRQAMLASRSTKLFPEAEVVRARA